MTAHWLLSHGGFWVVVYGQTIAANMGGSWVALGGTVIERAYVGPLLAPSWRTSVGSRLANHGAGQQADCLLSWWLLGGSG